MHDVTARQPAATTAEDAAEAHVPLPLRNDTVLGVCEAIGRDFGFNPNWLRVAFAMTLYWAPMVVIGLYVGLAITVGTAHYFFPSPRSAATAGGAPAKLQANDEGEVAIAA